MNAMTFAIISIFIQNKVDNTIIGVNQSSTLYISSPGISLLSIPVTVHCLEDMFNTLTSEPARPSLAPLSTKDPCLSQLA